MGASNLTGYTVGQKTPGGGTFIGYGVPTASKGTPISSGGSSGGSSSRSKEDQIKAAYAAAPLPADEVLTASQINQLTASKKGRERIKEYESARKNYLTSVREAEQASEAVTTEVNRPQAQTPEGRAWENVLLNKGMPLAVGQTSKVNPSDLRPAEAPRGFAVPNAPVMDLAPKKEPSLIPPNTISAAPKMSQEQKRAIGLEAERKYKEATGKDTLIGSVFNNPLIRYGWKNTGLLKTGYQDSPRGQSDFQYIQDEYINSANPFKTLAGTAVIGGTVYGKAALYAAGFKYTGKVNSLLPENFFLKSAAVGAIIYGGKQVSDYGSAAISGNFDYFRNNRKLVNEASGAATQRIRQETPGLKGLAQFYQTSAFAGDRYKQYFEQELRARGVSDAQAARVSRIADSRQGAVDFLQFSATGFLVEAGSETIGRTSLKYGLPTIKTGSAALIRRGVTYEGAKAIAKGAVFETYAGVVGEDYLTDTGAYALDDKYNKALFTFLEPYGVNKPKSDLGRSALKATELLPFTITTAEVLGLPSIYLGARRATTKGVSKFAERAASVPGYAVDLNELGGDLLVDIYSPRYLKGISNAARVNTGVAAFSQIGVAPKGGKANINVNLPMDVRGRSATYSFSNVPFSVVVDDRRPIGTRSKAKSPIDVFEDVNEKIGDQVFSDVPQDTTQRTYNNVNINTKIDFPSFTPVLTPVSKDILSLPLPFTLPVPSGAGGLGGRRKKSNFVNELFYGRQFLEEQNQGINFGLITAGYKKPVKRSAKKAGRRRK